MQTQTAGGIGLLLGILSDTHRRVKRAERIIELFVALKVEMIIHAGDIVEEDILASIKATGIPYVAVFGNNDRHLLGLQKEFNLVREPYEFELPGDLCSVKLMHIPNWLSPQQELIIFGHTHKKYINFTGKALFVNPGEACARNKDISECMTIKVAPEKFAIDYFYRKIKTDTWNKHTSEFQRQMK